MSFGGFTAAAAKVVLGVESEQLHAGLNAAEADVIQSTARMGGATAELADRQLRASVAEERWQVAMRKGAGAALEQRAALSALVTEQRKLADVQNVSTASTQRFERGLLAGSLRGVGMGRALMFASNAFIGGAGFVFALHSAISASSKFQGEMVLLQTQALTSAKEVRNMSKAALELSGPLATSPMALAKGLYRVESAAYRGADAVKVLTTAAKGARLGHSDLEATANALIATERSRIRIVHGVANDTNKLVGLTRAMSTIDAIVGSGNLRLEDLTRAFQSGVIPAAKQFGLSLQELGAALDTLTVQGQPAELSATRLRYTIALLGASTPKAEKELRQLGLSSSDVARRMRTEGLIPALELLDHKLKSSGLTIEDQNRILVRAYGGGRSSTTILALLQNIDKLKHRYKEIQQQGTPELFNKRWLAQKATAEFAFARLRADAQRTEIAIGNALSKPSVHAADAVAKWLENSQNQVHVQHLVTEGFKDGAAAAHVFGDGLHQLNDVLHVADTLLGGTHQALKLLIELLVLNKLAGFARGVNANLLTPLRATQKEADASAVSVDRLAAATTRLQRQEAQARTALYGGAPKAPTPMAPLGPWTVKGGSPAADVIDEQQAERLATMTAAGVPRWRQVGSAQDLEMQAKQDAEGVVQARATEDEAMQKTAATNLRTRTEQLRTETAYIKAEQANAKALGVPFNATATQIVVDAQRQAAGIQSSAGVQTESLDQLALAEQRVTESQPVANTGPYELEAAAARDATVAVDGLAAAQERQRLSATGPLVTNEILAQAKQEMLSAQSTATNLLQRRMGIGHERAAAIKQELTSSGWIAAQPSLQPSKPVAGPPSSLLSKEEEQRLMLRHKAALREAAKLPSQMPREAKIAAREQLLWLTAFSSPKIEQGFDRARASAGRAPDYSNFAANDPLLIQAATEQAIQSGRPSIRGLQELLLPPGLSPKQREQQLKSGQGYQRANELMSQLQARGVVSGGGGPSGFYRLGKMYEPSSFHPKYAAVEHYVRSGGEVSPLALQSAFGVTNAESQQLIDQLLRRGVVEMNPNAGEPIPAPAKGLSPKQIEAIASNPVRAQEMLGWKAYTPKNLLAEHGIAAKRAQYLASGFPKKEAERLARQTGLTRADAEVLASYANQQQIEAIQKQPTSLATEPHFRKIEGLPPLPREFSNVGGRPPENLPAQPLRGSGGLPATPAQLERRYGPTPGFPQAIYGPTPGWAAVDAEKLRAEADQREQIAREQTKLAAQAEKEAAAAERQAKKAPAVPRQRGLSAAELTLRADRARARVQAQEAADRKALAPFESYTPSAKAISLQKEAEKRARQAAERSTQEYEARQQQLSKPDPRQLAVEKRAAATVAQERASAATAAATRARESATAAAQIQPRPPAGPAQPPLWIPQGPTDEQRASDARLRAFRARRDADKATAAAEEKAYTDSQKAAKSTRLRADNAAAKAAAAEEQAHEQRQVAEADLKDAQKAQADFEKKQAQNARARVRKPKVVQRGGETVLQYPDRTKGLKSSPKSVAPAVLQEAQRRGVETANRAVASENLATKLETNLPVLQANAQALDQEAAAAEKTAQKTAELKAQREADRVAAEKQTRAAKAQSETNAKAAVTNEKYSQVFTTGISDKIGKSEQLRTRISKLTQAQKELGLQTAIAQEKGAPAVIERQIAKEKALGEQIDVNTNAVKRLGEAEVVSQKAVLPSRPSSGVVSSAEARRLAILENPPALNAHGQAISGGSTRSSLQRLRESISSSTTSSYRAASLGASASLARNMGAVDADTAAVISETSAREMAAKALRATSAGVKGMGGFMGGPNGMQRAMGLGMMLTLFGNQPSRMLGLHGSAGRGLTDMVMGAGSGMLFGSMLNINPLLAAGIGASFGVKHVIGGRPGSWRNKAGSLLGGAAEGAGVGALAGTLGGPLAPISVPVGAGIGAAAGLGLSLFGALKSHSESAASAIGKLGDAAFGAQVNLRGARRGVIQAQGQLANDRVGRDDAKTSLQQAQAEEKAARGTKDHKVALDKLRAAQQNYRQSVIRVNDDLRLLANAHKNVKQKIADEITTRAKLTTKLKQIAIDSRGEAAAQAMYGQKLTGNSTAAGRYSTKLEGLAKSLHKQHPRLAAIAGALALIARTTNHIPNRKVINLVVQTHGLTPAVRALLASEGYPVPMGPGDSGNKTGSYGGHGGAATRNPTELQQAKIYERQTRGTPAHKQALARLKSAKEAAARGGRGGTTTHQRPPFIDPASSNHYQHLETMLAAAQFKGDVGAQRRILKEEERWLLNDLKNARTDAQRSTIYSLLNGIKGSLSALDSASTSNGGVGIIPQPLQDREQRAEQAGNKPAEIRALQAEASYLRRYLKRPGLSAKQHHKAMTELTQVDNKIRRLEGGSGAGGEIVPPKLQIRLQHALQDYYRGKSSKSQIAELNRQEKIIEDYLKEPGHTKAERADARRKLAQVKRQEVQARKGGGGALGVIKALDAEEAYLRHYAHDRHHSLDQRLKAEKELTRLERQEATFRKKLNGGLGGANLIPYPLQIAYERAKRTPGTKDDVKALKGEQKFLQHYLEGKHTEKERAKAEHLLTGIDLKLKKLIDGQNQQMKQQQQHFLSEQASFWATFASNDFHDTPGGRQVGADGGTSLEVHQHFPHKPTADGHREARVAKAAMQAAFD